MNRIHIVLILFYLSSLSVAVTYWWIRLEWWIHILFGMYDDSRYTSESTPCCDEFLIFYERTYISYRWNVVPLSKQVTFYFYQSQYNRTKLHPGGSDARITLDHIDATKKCLFFFVYWKRRNVMGRIRSYEFSLSLFKDCCLSLIKRLR